MKTKPAVPLQARQIRHAPKINFHIGRLTLEDYSRADQLRFTRMLERRLRDLACSASAQDWSAIKSTDIIHAGTLPAAATPEQAARHIARQIFLKLRRKEDTHA